MAYTIGYDEVKHYLKTCSTKRLDKISHEIWAMLEERDNKMFVKYATKKSKQATTSKQHSGN